MYKPSRERSRVPEAGVGIQADRLPQTRQRSFLRPPVVRGVVGDQPRSRPARPLDPFQRQRAG